MMVIIIRMSLLRGRETALASSHTVFFVFYEPFTQTDLMNSLAPDPNPVTDES